ncbi:AAA family ATPase [Micromonospora chalcea]
MNKSAQSVVSSLTDDWNTSRNSARGWPKFLESVRITGLRGWSGESVEFRYPVTALAGENGSGKSTVLKVLASAYRNLSNSYHAQTFNPEDFFPNTPWETVRSVTLTYRVREGDSLVVQSVRKPTSRWRGLPDRKIRSTFFLDISRTQPIDTLIGYGKIAKQQTFAGDGVDLKPEYRELLSRVMRKPYSVSRIFRKSNKQVGVLSVGGKEYSNFHQGAGEDATTDLVALLQDVPRHSLVIIDEVEASLHPRAQRRLMTELIDIARRNRLQFVVSTHSPYILEQLPTEARIYIQPSRTGRREIVYGVTPNFALSMMDDTVHPELTLYCEDLTAKVFAERLLAAADDQDLIKRIRVVPVGPADTVRTLGRVAEDGAFAEKCLGVLDGDQAPARGCVVLPGGLPPERAAFVSLSDEQWEEVARRLAVRPGDLLDSKEDAMCLDQHHAWSRRVAESLGPRIRASRVWEDVAAVYAEMTVAQTDREAFADSVFRLLR